MSYPKYKIRKGRRRRTTLKTIQWKFQNQTHQDKERRSVIMAMVAAAIYSGHSGLIRDVTPKACVERAAEIIELSEKKCGVRKKKK